MSVFVRARSGGAGQLVIRGLTATIADDASAGAFVTVLFVPLLQGGSWTMEANPYFELAEATGVVTTSVADIPLGSYTPQVLYTVALGPLAITLTADLSITVAEPPPPPPVFTDPPSISGIARVGETLTGDVGTVTGGTVDSVEWRSASEPVPGEEGMTFDLPVETAETMITFAVVASGPGGTVTAVSAPVGPVAYANISIDGTAFPDAIIGEAYHEERAIIGSVEPFDVSVIAGALPVWATASIAGRTLIIEGMPA